MNINEILKGVKCACGKEHTCDIEYVYIEKDAVKRVAEICKNNKNILIVADENTFEAAGKSVEAVLSDKTVNKVVFPGSSILIPDERAIKTVNDNLHETDMIIGVGSGVIQDLCKYVSFFAKLPYMVVATAPSMDGYASDGAAMILEGMKENLDEIQLLSTYFNFEKEDTNSKNENGQTICFTGKMEHKRSEMEKFAESIGFIPLDHVDKNLSILVCADPNGNSSKLTKARKNGTKIISEQEFMSMLNK